MTTMVVLFLRHCLIVSKTKTGEVTSRAEVASSVREVRKVDRSGETCTHGSRWLDRASKQGELPVSTVVN